MSTRAATARTSNVARANATAALAAWQRGEATPAEALKALWPVVRDAADHSNLGALLRALGKPSEAASAYRRAIALDPHFAAAPYNLGNLLCDAGALSEAEAAYRTALAARPAYPEALNALGTVLQRRGKLADAVEAFRAAAGHAPQWVEPQTNLGVALLGLERYDAARKALQAAIAIDAAHASAHGNLGAVYLRAGCPMAAEQATCEAIRLAPNEHRWITNLAVALQMQGRHAETEVCHRHALTLRPDYASGHGNLLFALNYREDLSAEAIFAEYQAWDARHARGLSQGVPFDIDRTEGRRLRVGFVSPDFRTHAVALFAEPLLAALDRDAMELFLYAEVPVEDAATARFRALADHWRPTVGLGDDDLAALIRQDRIDVLVDMAGHSAGNRLLVFARRPAPVQIAYLLGHGYTSGLSAMDAFLGDDALTPPGADALFSEHLIRLPRLPFAYRPPDAMPPVAPLPAASTGSVTLGYFGRLERVNAGVIATWSRILHALPRARLVLNNRSFQERDFCRVFLDRFTAHDVGRDRVALTYTAPQPATWAAYGTIDIALDPFPHNAGTTTIEALWQGVPVVSLAGRPSVGRFGAAILHAAGLDDWVTESQDAYVSRTVAAATDLDALATLRASLRPRLQASPLLDADGLARCVEQVVRGLWDAWRERDLAEPAQANAAEAAPVIPERLVRTGQAGPDRACADGWVEAGGDESDGAAVEPGQDESGGAAIEAGRDGDRSVPAEAGRRENEDAPGETGHDDAVTPSPATAAVTAKPATQEDPELRRLFAAGDFAAAKQLAEQILARDPAAATAAHVAGLIAHREARFDDADRYLCAAIAAAPNDPEQYANHAAVLRTLGRLGDAEAAARAALRLAPGRVETHNNLGNILRDSRPPRRKHRLLPGGAAPRPGVCRCLVQPGLGAVAERPRTRGGGCGQSRDRRRSAEQQRFQQSRRRADAAKPSARGRNGVARGSAAAAGFRPAAQQHSVLPELPRRTVARDDFRRIPAMGRTACPPADAGGPAIRAGSHARAAPARRLLFAGFPHPRRRPVRRAAAGRA